MLKDTCRRFPSFLLSSSLLLTLLLLLVTNNDYYNVRAFQQFQSQKQQQQQRRVLRQARSVSSSLLLSPPSSPSSPSLLSNQQLKEGRRRGRGARNSAETPTTPTLALNSHPITSIASTASAAASTTAAAAVNTVLGTIASFLKTRLSSSITVSKLIRFTAIAVATLFVAKYRKRIFDPNSLVLLDPNKNDDSNSNNLPLPPKAKSCPLIGNQILVGSKNYGTGYFYHNMSKLLGHPRIWLYSFLGIPGVVMSGGQRLKNFLSLEFNKGDNNSESIYAGMKSSKLMTADSLLNENDKTKHSALRRLVGAAMTPSMVSASVPYLQAAAEMQVNKMLDMSSSSNKNKDDIITMEHRCTEYTLDVAWKQLLGLNLSEEEIPIFRDAVDTWINGFTSIKLILNIGSMSKHPAIKAKTYLESLIRDKIHQLEQTGPDDSTLSGMVFARDDGSEEDEIEVDGENTNKKKKGTSSSSSSVLKLTTEQVVENAFLLILAGSETSATTLTNAVLGLGYHKNVWKKLVQEQRELFHKYQTTTKNQSHQQQQHRNGTSSSSLGDDVITNNNISSSHELFPYRFPLTQKDIDSECPYLDAVVRETMRIKPIPSGVPRITNTTLQMDGYTIPKGWMVNWNVQLTHELDPTTYKEDGSHMEMSAGFVPERWLDKSTRPTTDFMPMGAGPRYCLGSTLAYAEMKVFLAVLAQTIDYDLIDDETTSSNNKKEKKKRRSIVWKRMSIIPKPANGVPVRVRPAAAAAKTKTTTTTYTKKEGSSTYYDSSKEKQIAYN